ncbi:Zinc finger, TRAF-type [Sesbania bispinosa]|nr:Zinc finger, TRAF-type [Sesbania bispinosa]
MSILSSMDMPTVDVDLGPEKIEDEKEGGPLVHCDLCDTEVVHKLAQMFLPGLASACVDNTSGDLFKTPGSVAVDLRKELIDYLTQRSESFVAESIILEGGPDGEVSDHPFDIISNFVDDFASSKRNLFSRVSGWLLSDKREDKIDDFVQEMEMNGFWTLDRRETIAETLLKNVDFENSFHCSMKFNSAEELANHVDDCNFRTMICDNEGCNARFCAGHLKKHDSTCPFKIIPCEQKCSDNIMRRDMDRHCITVCPMKLVNCPFYAVGCRSAVAQCMIEKHRSDDVNSHLWHLLKGIYKEASGDDLKRRVEQIVEASSISHLAKARDVRSLNFIVKDIEAKLGPFEVTVVEKNSAETIGENDDKEDSDTNKNSSEQSTQASDMVNSSDKAEVSGIAMHGAENTAKNEDSEHSSIENKGSGEKRETSNIAKLPDEAGIGHMKEDSAPIYNENKDVTASELKIKGNEMNTQTNMENKGSEEKTETSNIAKLPDEAEIGHVKEGSAPIYNENKDVTASELKIKGNEVNTQTNMENKGSEEKTETSNIAKLPDEAEIGHVKEGSAPIYNENKDVTASELKIKGNEVNTQTNMENKGSEEKTETSNIAKLPDEAEIGHVKEGSAPIYNENKDVTASELKIKGNEVNTQTNMENLSEETSATTKDSAENSIKNSSIEDRKFEDKDNGHGIQDSKMETKGSAENNLKNKDIENDNLKENTQT